MNPLTNVRNIKKLSETELKYNISGKASWHNIYKDSAWVFIGGLPYDLSEGDVICIFSQYGEVVNINLVRDKGTGKSKGFCFLCYEDQRSTILAVDNLNSIKVCGRTLRVDHVEQYKIPKDPDRLDEEALQILQEGCGPESSVIKSLQAPKPAPLPENIHIKEEIAVSIQEKEIKKQKSPSPRRKDGSGERKLAFSRNEQDERERSEDRSKDNSSERKRADFRNKPSEKERWNKKDSSKDRRERSKDRDHADKRGRLNEERSGRRERSKDRERSEKERKNRRH